MGLDEHQAWADKAKEQGVTIQRLLLERTQSGGEFGDAGLRRELGAELFGAHRQIAALGVNLNQIARATNATRETQPELFAVLDAVLRSLARVDAAVDELIAG